MLNKPFNAYKSNVTIKLAEPVEMPTGITYAEKHQFLSSQARQVDIFYGDKHVYSCTVPKNVFNPHNSIVPSRCVELILDGTIPVKGRRMIDLGCGSVG